LIKVGTFVIAESGSSLKVFQKVKQLIIYSI
jgi:hypothetical protein